MTKNNFLRLFLYIFLSVSLWWLADSYQEQKEERFQELRNEIILDLKEHFGTNLGVIILDKDVNIFFTYGRSNFNYKIGRENYQEVFLP